MYSIDDLDRWIQQGEGQSLEFKLKVNASLARELAAFANTTGGRIVLGIDDDGNKIGLSPSNGIRSRIQTIASSCDPEVDVRMSEVADLDNKKYIILDVPEGKNKPYRFKDGYHRRVGPSSIKMTTEQLVSVIQSQGRVQFDARIWNHDSWEDLFSNNIITRYREIANINKRSSDLGFLKNIGAVEGTFPTYAGILMFTENPVDIFPQSMVQCTLYQDTTKSQILDRKDLSGDLIFNIVEALIFLKRHLNIRRQIQKSEATNELEIPEPVLREAVVNAILHRDYLIKGAHVVVEIFADRIDISSPGSLPPQLSADEFGERSVARNPVLAEILRRTPYIEKLGSGIPRIKYELSEAGLHPPVFKFNGFFAVSIRRKHRDGPGLSNPTKLNAGEEIDWKPILLHLSGGVSGRVSGGVMSRLLRELKMINRRKLNTNQLALELKAPKDTVEKDLRRLKEWGVILFEGAFRTGGYVLSSGTKKLIDEG